MTDIYTVPEVALRLRCTVRTVQSMIRDGRLKAAKVGKEYRIAASEVDQLFEK